MASDPSEKKEPAPKPATPPPSGAAPSAGEGSGTFPEVGEVGALLREIRDRLPPPAASPPPPGRWRRLGRWLNAKVRAAEPWGILLAILGLFGGLCVFWIDYGDRVKERTVRAWQVLTTRAPRQ